MEADVAGPGPGLHLGGWRPGRGKGAGGRVERELADPIVAQRGHEHVTVRRIDEDRVRVGIAGQDLGRRLDGADRPDRIHRDPVPGIRCTQEEAAGAVEGDVGQAVGERTAGDVPEAAARGVDGEPGRDLRLAPRAHVEHAAVGAHRHRRRATGLLDARDRHLLHDGEVAVPPVELEHDDLVALGVPDVDDRGGAAGRSHQAAVYEEAHREQSRLPSPCAPSPPSSATAALPTWSGFMDRALGSTANAPASPRRADQVYAAGRRDRRVWPLIAGTVFRGASRDWCPEGTARERCGRRRSRSKATSTHAAGSLPLNVPASSMADDPARVRRSAWSTLEPRGRVRMDSLL